MDFFSKEIIKLIKDSETKRSDRNQIGPRPEDFGEHLPISEEAVIQLPLETPDLIEKELEEKPVSETRGVIVLDLLGDNDG